MSVCFPLPCFWLEMGDPGLTLALPSSQLMEKHSDICKKVKSVFEEPRLSAFDALKWNVKGAPKKDFAGILNMFHGMAVSSEVRAWLPRLALWKGELIYMILVCLLNKTALLFCCHTSLNL